ncbi:large ribosomal subunit protein mL37 [Neocloeon triangulifer]|uniref:large ribosomal subunit protein mL37 n=1 Tax=Neocloeon triangulifer TaxID=2078957 RepID=UPI00286FAA4C|nr:large ribosomal subunit protein mL37 [Neocloeon triangulifer]
MRLTLVLHKQHLRRLFIRKWFVHGRNNRVPMETYAESTLSALGIKVVDSLDVIDEKKTPPVPPGSVKVIGMLDPPVPLGENHPLYHQRPSYLYDEHSILVEGLPQAQNLTNTVILEKGLPPQIEELAKENESLLPEECHEEVKKSILRSFLFDAVQEKMPKYINPERPCYNYPPTFGVPDYRRNRLLSDNLLLICDSLSSEPHGQVVRGAKLRTLLDINDKLVRFDISPGILLCGKNPLSPYTDAARTENLDLPNISPLNCFVSLPKDHFYDDTEIINVPPAKFVHTAIFHFNDTKHVNLTEIPVNENQIQGRTLANSFIVAAAEAKQKLEKPSGELSKPLTIQGIHTNGQWFQFSVLQLNNLSNKGTKNVAWLSPLMHMFASARYEKAVPTLIGYNPDVLRYLFAFHRNSLITK